MGIRESILAPWRKPRWAVILNGVDVTNDAMSGSVESSFAQVANTASVVFQRRPFGAEESGTLQLWMGYDDEIAPVFTGQFSGVDWSLPGRVTLPARSQLAKTLPNWGGGDRPYNNQTAAEIIRNMLEIVGISQHNIVEDDPPWTLAVLQELVFKNETPPWSLIQRIDVLEGYQTYEGPDGVVYRRRIAGNPSNFTLWDFVEGRDMITASRSRRTEGAINQWTITGLKVFDADPVTATVSAVNTYLDQEVAPELRPRYVADSITDDLVETGERALAIAQRKVADTNRRPETATIATDGNPLIQLGASVSITSDKIAEGYALAIVTGIQHAFGPDGFFSTVTTNGGSFSGYNASAPYAQFTATTHLEHEDTGSGVEERIIVVADGTASFDPDGSEGDLLFNWDPVTVDAGTITIVGGTTSRKLRAIISGAATTVTITLTVTDAQTYTNSLTRTIPLSPRTALALEALWTAEGTKAAYSGDGQKTWNEQTPASEVRCLCPFAPYWGNLYGGQDGHVYASFDGLTTPMIDLGAPAPSAGACTAVWVHELLPTRLWAGFNDGTVAYALLDIEARAIVGAWVVRGNVGAGPVREIIESYNTFDEVRATAGQRYSISRDGGQTWTLIFTFDVAWRMTAGYERQFASGLNDASPLREENGFNVTLPVGTDHIRALAMGWRDPELYLANEDGGLLLAPDLATATQTGTSPVGVNHMVRSGSEDGIVYLAGGDGIVSNGGVLKSIRMADPFYLRRTGTRPVYMVGYGPLVSPGVPPVVATIYRPTRALSPGGVYKYNFMTGIWTLKNTGLPTGIYWHYIAASPQNPSKLIMLGTNDPGASPTIVSGTARMPNGEHCCWRSDDAAETWYAQPLPVPAGTAQFDRVIVAEFDKNDASKALVSGLVKTVAGPFEPLYLATWRISGVTATAVRESSTAWGGNLNPAAASGSDGDVVSQINERWGYLPTAASAHTLVSTPAPATVDNHLVVWPGTNRGAMIIGFLGDGPRTSPDYRVSPLALRSGGVWDALDRQFFDVLADGSVVIATAANFVRMINPFGSATTSAVGPVAVKARRWTRADQQTRRVVAAITEGEATIAYFDGATWQEIPGPPISDADLAPVLEVVAP